MLSNLKKAFHNRIGTRSSRQALVDISNIRTGTAPSIASNLLKDATIAKYDDSDDDRSLASEFSSASKTEVAGNKVYTRDDVESGDEDDDLSVDSCCKRAMEVQNNGREEVDLDLTPVKKRRRKHKRDVADLTFEELELLEINPRCNIDLKEKIGWALTTLPPPTHRDSIDNLLSWIQMDPLDKAFARDTWKNLPPRNTKKGKFEREMVLCKMIGSDCEHKRCPKGCAEPAPLKVCDMRTETFSSVCLNCELSVKALMNNKKEMAPYKKKGTKKNLQPTPAQRLSIDALKAFWTSSRDEQDKAKEKWRKLTQKEKEAIKAQIPGGQCACQHCRVFGKRTSKTSKPRSDKGKTRRPYKKRASRKRKRAGRQDDDESMPEATDSQYRTLADGNEARETLLASHNDTNSNYVRPKAKEPARSIRAQGGALARDGIWKAMKSFAQALTQATMAAVENAAGRLCYKQDIPRIRMMLVIYRDVKWSRANGGNPPEREKKFDENPELTYVTTCSDDVFFIMDKMCNTPANVIKTKIYGTGDKIFNAIDEYITGTKSKRAKKKKAPTVSDSTNAIPEESAPALPSPGG